MLGTTHYYLCYYSTTFTAETTHYNGLMHSSCYHQTNTSIGSDLKFSVSTTGAYIIFCDVGGFSGTNGDRVCVELEINNSSTTTTTEVIDANPGASYHQLCYSIILKLNAGGFVRPHISSSSAFIPNYINFSGRQM